MSEAVFVEYMGFISTAQEREYAFHVRFSPQDSHGYTATITREAFNSRRVGYQDRPGVCSSRLKRQLTANPDVRAHLCEGLTDEYMIHAISATYGVARKAAIPNEPPAPLSFSSADIQLASWQDSRYSVVLSRSPLASLRSSFYARHRYRRRPTRLVPKP
jgi:hypothetical protein